MGWKGLPLISIVTFLPVVGALIILFINKNEGKLIKATGIIVTTVDFFISLIFFFAFRAGNPDFQFVEKLPWITSWGINYYVGIDGISLFLVLLTTFITPITLLSTWKAIEKKEKEFVVFMLLLETAMLGAFVSLNLVLFYLFWELMLIPMYFIIGVWGGERRIYAAVKFFIYTAVGSLLMLLAILYIYYVHYKQFGFYSFDYDDLFRIVLSFKEQLLLFSAFGLAFAIKVPMFPFHTWLPDAHVEAPTAGSVILAGILLKMGTYGFLRFAMPLFPLAAQAAAPYIMALAVVGIIYGALVAMVQKDVKKLIAYSSVSHLGYVMLGLFAFNLTGIQGGLLQMINHGLSTGALFLLVGVIYERRHTRLISEFGGIAKVMPWYAAIFMVIMLSSIGLPGLNGFVGEFLVLVGAFKAAFANYLKDLKLSHFVFVILAASGMIWGAVYMLWMYQRVFFNKLTNPKNFKLPDLSLREAFIFVLFLIFIVWIGVYPRTFLSRTEASINKTINRVMVTKEEYYRRALNTKGIKISEVEKRIIAEKVSMGDR